MPSRARGSLCTSTTSGCGARRLMSVRSMPMAGVLPLPAVTIRIWGGGWSGRTNSPCAGPSRRTVPGRVRWAGRGDTVPSGIALTVIVRSPSSRPGTEVREYVRPCHTPPTSTPTGRYRPARCPDHPRPGRRVSVAASAVSGLTAVTRPTGKRASRRGFTSPRQSSGVSGLVSRGTAVSNPRTRAGTAGIHGVLSSHSTRSAAYVESSRARLKQRNHDRANRRAARRRIPPHASCGIQRGRIRTAQWAARARPDRPGGNDRKAAPIPLRPTAA